MKQVNSLSSEVANILEKKGWTQRDLALRAGVNEKHLSKVLSGSISLSIELAVAFEFVLEKEATEWLDMDRAEKIQQIRGNDNSNDALFKNFKPCYSELVKQKEIKKSDNPHEDLLKFFGVSSLQQVEHVEKIAFRGEKSEVDQPTLAAWLRVGEIKAKKQTLGASFNKTLIKEYLPRFRALTLSNDGAHVSSELKRMCSECGIHLIFTPYYKKTYINGAVRWLKDAPLIQLNDKLNYKDTFWFSFFHELGHLVLHSKKIFDEPFMRNAEEEEEQPEFFEFKKDFDLSTEDRIREQEADEFAQKSLIPAKYYKEIRNFLIKNPLESVINHYSKAIEVDRGIIAGRLAFEGYVKYPEASRFRTRLKFS